MLLSSDLLYGNWIEFVAMVIVCIKLSIRIGLAVLAMFGPENHVGLASCRAFCQKCSKHNQKSDCLHTYTYSYINNPSIHPIKSIQHTYMNTCVHTNELTYARQTVCTYVCTCIITYIHWYILTIIYIIFISISVVIFSSLRLSVVVLTVLVYSI